MIGKIFSVKDQNWFCNRKATFQGAWWQVKFTVDDNDDDPDQGHRQLDMMMGRSRFSVVVERRLTVGWQSLDRVSMNHLVCPLIPTSHPLPSQTPLKACKPQQVTAHQDVKTLCSFQLSPGESDLTGRVKKPASSEEVDLSGIRSTTGGWGEGGEKLFLYIFHLHPGHMCLTFFQAG